MDRNSRGGGQGATNVLNSASVKLYPNGVSLDAWVRASFSAAPWVGVNSPGTSGTNNLVTAGHNPTTGTAVNTLVPASSDGTKLLSAGLLSKYATVDVCCGAVLIRPTDVTTASMVLCSDDVVTTPFAIKLTGGTVVCSVADDTKTVAQTISANAYSLITWRKSATVLQVGVNEDPGSAGGGTTLASTTAISSIAKTLYAMNQSTFDGGFPGTMLELFVSKSNITAAQFAGIKTYVNDRYSLSL